MCLLVACYWRFLGVSGLCDQLQSEGRLSRGPPIDCARSPCSAALTIVYAGDSYVGNGLKQRRCRLGCASKTNQGCVDRFKQHCGLALALQS